MYLKERGTLIVGLFILGAILLAIFTGPIPESIKNITGLEIAEIQASCGGGTTCSCGDILTSSRNLTAGDSLEGCTSDVALYIEGEGISLNCTGEALGSNGDSNYGIQLRNGANNVEIHSCRFFNFTIAAINLNYTGNNTHIHNNLFNTTYFDGQDVLVENLSNVSVESNDFSASPLINKPRVMFSGVYSGIFRLNNVSNISEGATGLYLNNSFNITVSDNIFNTSSAGSGTGLLVTGTNTSLIDNNTLIGLRQGIVINGSRDSFNNIFRRNVYQSLVYGVTIIDDKLNNVMNNTFINENITGSSYAYVVNTSNLFLENKFMNTSVGESNKILFIGNSSLAMIDEELVSGSSLVEQNNLFTHINTTNATTTLTRNVIEWTTTTVTVRETYSNNVTVNYTLFSGYTANKFNFLVDGELNATLPLGSPVSQTVNIAANTPTNITFTLSNTCGGSVPCNCGDTLAVSRDLNASDSVFDCDGTSITMGFPDTALNCNGLELTGNGSNKINIATVSGAIQNLSIRNCVITNANIPIAWTASSGAGDNSIIENNILNVSGSGGTASGISLFGPEGVTIRNNTIIGANQTSSDYGLFILATNRVNVTGNSISNFGTGMLLGSPTLGPVTNTIVSGNQYNNLTFGMIFNQNASTIADNNFIRDENISGLQTAMGLTGEDIFVSSALVNVTTTSGGILLEGRNTTFAMKGDSDSVVTLETNYRFFEFDVKLDREVVEWTTGNISVLDTYNRTVVVNYTVYTNQTEGNLTVYWNGTFNQTTKLVSTTYPLTAKSMGSISFLTPADQRNNLTFSLPGGEVQEIVEEGETTTTTPTEGGGGGGGAAIIKEVIPVCRESATFATVTTETITSFEFDPKEFFLVDISFKAKKTLENIAFLVDASETQPVATSSSPSGDPILFYEFELTNFEISDIEESDISFILPFSLVPSGDPNDISLESYDPSTKNWRKRSTGCIIDSSFAFSQTETDSECLEDISEAGLLEEGERFYLCSAPFRNGFPKTFVISIGARGFVVDDRPETIVGEEVPEFQAPELFEEIPVLGEVVTNPFVLAAIVALAVILVTLLVIQEIMMARKPIQSMKKYYKQFKDLQQKYYKETNAKKKSEQLLIVKEIRESLANGWLASTTKIIYDDKTANATIIQDYKAKMFKMSGKSSTVRLPVMRGVKIAALAQNQEAISYLQVLFGTKDNFEEITTVLEFVSGKNRNNILVFTPNQRGRVKNPVRIAGLDYEKAKFRVSGSGIKTLRKPVKKAKPSKKR